MRADTQTAPVATGDAAALLLAALAWTCGEDRRAMRLIDVTGLSPADLRARAGDPATLVAVGRFLADHEPDLVGCAAALDVPPQHIVAATAALAGE